MIPHRYHARTPVADRKQAHAADPHKVVAFLKTYRTEDAVNKISRVYEALDGMSGQGEAEKIAALLETVIQIIEGYDAGVEK